MCWIAFRGRVVSISEDVHKLRTQGMQDTQVSHDALIQNVVKSKYISGFKETLEKLYMGL